MLITGDENLFREKSQRTICSETPEPYLLQPMLTTFTTLGLVTSRHAFADAEAEAVYRQDESTGNL